MHYILFSSINHDCAANEKKEWRKKKYEIKILEMDLSTRRIIVKRFDMGKTKIGEREGWTTGGLEGTLPIDVCLIEACTKKKFISRSKEKILEDRKVISRETSQDSL